MFRYNQIGGSTCRHLFLAPVHFRLRFDLAMENKPNLGKIKPNMGCGGGLVVSVLAFYSDDPSSIPAEVYNFFCKIVVEKNENKQKEAGVGPILKKT